MLRDWVRLFLKWKKFYLIPKLVGLVVDEVDKIMHGMELGTAGMHNQVRQWALQGFIAQLLDLLLNHSFRVF